MNLFLLGIALFIGIHLVPVVPPLRSALMKTLGEMPYKGLFTLLAVAGLVLIVMGWSDASTAPVYEPPAWGRHLAFSLVPIAFILFAAANMPGHIRYRLKHPMLIGTVLWACAHLSANGDERSVTLFGAFAIWAIIDLISEIARGRTLIGAKAPRVSMDIAAVVGGLLVAGAIMHFHGKLFGMPLIG